MKFRCERDALVEALSTVGRATAGRSGALPVLAGVRAEVNGSVLTLLGTDLELTIRESVEVAGEADGAAVLPARLATDVVRSLADGAVSVVVTDDGVGIAAGRSEFSLRTIPAEDFPRPTEPDGQAVTLPAKEFALALKQVVPAASTDDSRPVLTGVLLAAEGTGVRLVATDSYRLALRDLPGTQVLAEGQAVLLPSRALAEVARLVTNADEVVLRLGARDASFEIGRVHVTTRVIEGDFPNYRALIPASHPNRLTVNRAEFLEAVRRVRLLARESTPLRLVMKPDGLDLLAVTQDVGEAHESIDASYEGSELTVAFNPEYLLDGLEVTQSDEVVLHTLDARNPAVVRGGDNDDFLYLLMPVRVT